MIIPYIINSRGKIRKDLSLFGEIRRIIYNNLDWQKALIDKLCLDTATGEHLDRLSKIMDIKR